MLLKRIISASQRGAVAIAGAQDDMLVWDEVHMCSDLRFKSLGVTKLAILSRFAYGAEQEKPNLGLYVDVHIDFRPKLIARRRLLRCDRLSANHREDEKQDGTRHAETYSRTKTNKGLVF